MSSPVGYPQRNAYPMFSSTSQGDVPVGKNGANLIPVMANVTPSSGGVVFDDMGVEWVKNPITGILRVKRAPEGVNSLINTPPTVRFAPVDASHVLTCTTSGTATFSVSDVACPITGMKMLKMVVPPGDNSTQEVRFYSIAADKRFSMDPDDIWFCPIRVESDINSAPNMFLRVADTPTPGGTRYRQLGFSADQWRPGTNVLSCLNVETLVNSITYGTAGTSITSVWAEDAGGLMTPGATIQSISQRFTNVGGLTVYIGCIATAKPGWAKSVFVWEADDVPLSFWQLAIPEYEKRGIPVTLNVVPGYTNRAGYMTRAQVRDAIRRGHEISGHAWFHENSVSNAAIYPNALAQARRHWIENGVETAIKTMAWVQTDHNAAARQMALDAGIQFARGSSGRFASPICPAAGPRCLPSVSTEISNSWQVDTLINGAAKRGQIMRTYQHTTVAGGESTNNYPDAVQHYLAHKIRWLDRFVAERDAGRAIAVTWTDCLRLSGIDPMRGEFPE